MSMSKLEMLFVRACKCKNPKTRLKSLYRRFYLTSEHHEFHIISTLADIIDKYKTVKIVDIVLMLNLDRHFNFEEKLSYNENCMETLMNIIRFSEVDVFPGYIEPAYFRNRRN